MGSSILCTCTVVLAGLAAWGAPAHLHLHSRCHQVLLLVEQALASAGQARLLLLWQLLVAAVVVVLVLLGGMAGLTWAMVNALKDTQVRRCMWRPARVPGLCLQWRLACDCCCCCRRRRRCTPAIDGLGKLRGPGRCDAGGRLSWAHHMKSVQCSREGT